MKYINKAYEIFHRYRFIFEVIFVLSLYAASYYKLGGFYFETNDDHTLEDVMSGALTGTCDNHTIHNGVIYPSIVSFLYKTIPSLPWHGIMLMLFHVLLILIPLNFATSVVENWGGATYLQLWALALAFCFHFIRMFFFNIPQQQYFWRLPVICALYCQDVKRVVLYGLRSSRSLLTVFALIPWK